MAYRDRDTAGSIKIIRDTKFQRMPFNNVADQEATNQYNYQPVEHDFYIPLNRRYQISTVTNPATDPPTAKLFRFPVINWCVLGTFNPETAPNFRVRIDIFYKN